MSQSPLDRLLGCGTLTIDSIGDRQAVLDSVPHVQQVQTTLYELIDADRALYADEDAEDDDEPEVPAQPDRRGLRRFTRG
jgi:Bacterial PH domain